jgi:hypothetical protein
MQPPTEERSAAPDAVVRESPAGAPGPIAAATEPATRRLKARIWLRRLAPYAIAGTAIIAILSRYSLREIGRELARGDWLAVAPLALLLMLVNLLFVSTADSIVLRACSRAPGWVGVLVGKAGSAVLGSIGYAAAHGGYGVWIARKTGAGVALTSGIVLYIMASELAAVSIVASGSIHIAGAEVERGLAIAAPSIALTLVLPQIAAPLGLLGKSGVKVFEPWSRVMPLAAIAQQATRVTQICSMVFITWLGARAFGMPIPLTIMAAYLPIVLVVGSLPVNVAGFGAVQLAWLQLAPWSSGEQVLAFSVVWQLMSGAAMVIRGLPFVRRVVSEIDEGTRPNP